MERLARLIVNGGILRRTHWGAPRGLQFRRAVVYPHDGIVEHDAARNVVRLKRRALPSDGGGDSADPIVLEFSISSAVILHRIANELRRAVDEVCDEGVFLVATIIACFFTHHHHRYRIASFKTSSVICSPRSRLIVCSLTRTLVRCSKRGRLQLLGIPFLFYTVA